MSPMSSAISAAEQIDSNFQKNIASIVASFTKSFYYDDPTGKSVFGYQLSELEGPSK
jgi:hypothetical protein